MKKHHIVSIRFLLSSFLILAYAASATMAHEDPRGDVHPTVTVKDGAFVVTAFDNTNSTDTSIRRVHLEVDRIGTVLQKKREDIPRPPSRPYESYSFMQKLPEEQNGLERKSGDGWMIIPEWSRKHSGRPYIIECQQASFTYHSLNWAKTDVHQVVDVIVTIENLYLLVSRFNTKHEPELCLHRFSTSTYKEEASVLLPKPCLIWSFPVCSNLILQDGAAHVAIVTDYLFGFNLVLATWDGVSTSCGTRVMTNRIDWNTSVSLANIDNDALIAFHYAAAYPRILAVLFPSKAEIKTIYTKLKKP